jgi:hypothetical protein
MTTRQRLTTRGDGRTPALYASDGLRTGYCPYPEKHDYNAKLQLMTNNQFDTLLQRDRFLQLHGRRNYEVFNKNFKARWYILAVMVQQPMNPYEKRRERRI